jgi:thioredoxin reductase
MPGVFAIGSVRENLFSQIAVHIADGVLAARKVYINHHKRMGTGD